MEEIKRRIDELAKMVTERGGVEAALFVENEKKKKNDKADC